MIPIIIGGALDPHSKELPTIVQSRDHHGSRHGIMSRLLSQTASTFHLDNYKHVGSGQDIDPDNEIYLETLLRKRNDLSNPLQFPPKNGGDAGEEIKLVTHIAPPLTKLHNEKCANISDPTYEDTRGKEWNTSPKTWVKRYGEDVSMYKWCKGGRAMEVPELERLMLLRSDRQIPNRAVSIITQLSIERLSMLEQQCAHWPHPISAVVYIPMVEGKISSTEDDNWNGERLIRGITAVEESYGRMKLSQCILDLEVVVEERCTFELATLYPTNALRNRALLLSRSDIVLLLDVDFVVDLSLTYVLEDEKKHIELTDMLSSAVAVVLPAFEAWDQGDRGKNIALTAVKEGKQYIAKKFMYNIVMGFHMAHYPQGHEPTLFWKWINTTEAYKVEHEIGFEPYILMAKKYVPYYDERFRGYYFNKVEQLLHVSSQLGLPFYVHPTSFVVHVPHAKAKTKWRTKRTGQKERNHVMFLDCLEDIKYKRFVPVTSFPHLCLPPDLQLATANAIQSGKQSSGAEAQVAMLTRMASEVQVTEEEHEMRKKQHMSLEMTRGHKKHQKAPSHQRNTNGAF